MTVSTIDDPKTKGGAKTDKKDLNKVLTCPVTDITADWVTNKSRYEKPEHSNLLALALNIEEHGLTQPVICVKEDGKLHLKVGFCRYEAIKILNEMEEQEGKPKTEIKYVLVDKNDWWDDKESFLKQLSENHFRGFSPMDLAHSMEVMNRDFAMSQEKIAEFFNYKSQATVSGYLSLLGLEDEFKKGIHRGIIPYTFGLKLVKAGNLEQRRKLILDAEEKASGALKVPPATPPPTQPTPPSSRVDSVPQNSGKGGSTTTSSTNGGGAGSSPRLPGMSTVPTFIKSVTDFYNMVEKWEQKDGKLQEGASRIVGAINRYFQGKIKGEELLEHLNYNSLREEDYETLKR